MAPATITISSDDEADYKPSASSSKSKSSQPSRSTPAKKRKSIAIGLSSSDDDKPSQLSAAKKKQKKKDDFIAEDDESEDDVKPKKKATPKAKPAAKKLKLAEDDDEDDKPKPAEKKVPVWLQKKSGPANPGSKEIPDGAPNCLEGLTFVFTGELDSLSREAGQDLVKRFGGRVTTAPSSKTSYVVLGSDAGPKKLEMIKKHQIKTVDEDGFLALIGKRPAGKPDPKLEEQKRKAEERIKQEAKTIGAPKGAAANTSQLWTTKYAPSMLKEICGNKGSVEKLSNWLSLFPKSLKSDFKKPGPDAMGTFRCVLISGPPGIGKTTAAHLVAKMHGYDVLELNASDVRSKKLLENAFKSKIDNTTVSGFFKVAGAPERDDTFGINTKSLIIMDEVDGMSAGDRGGVGALNALIKKTKVPIIAICNDKQNPKMKPLVHTCFQMQFKRPSANEIRARMMTIAFKEGIKMEGNVLDQLVQGSQSDIRQVVNMLSTWKLGAESQKMDYDQGKKLAKMNEKNSIQTPWTLYGKLFGPQAFSPVSSLSLNDKLDFYFHDHSIMPLFVQENYLKTCSTFTKASGFQGQDLALKRLELASSAADAMSDGDLVDAMIHGPNQQWSLMPMHGIMSTVTPAYYCHGGAGGQYPGFPAWLGKNSAQGKLSRMLGEVQIRMRLRISGDRKEIRQAYIPTLFPRLVEPLLEKGEEGVQEVIELMDEYFLTKEDWEAILELGFNYEATLKQIPAKVKSAFTRMYNKADHPVPFNKASDATAPKKMAAGAAPDLEEAFLDDDEADFEEDDAASGDEDDVTKDKNIKAKGAKKTAAKAKAKK